MNLQPFDKVLVRDEDSNEWIPDIFLSENTGSKHIFRCANSYWKQCILYEGNEHLMGTTELVEKEYNFKKGDIILGSLDKKKWVICIFLRKENSMYPYIATEAFDENNKLYENELEIFTWKYAKPFKEKNNGI